MTPQVSVVIPVYNESKAIIACLQRVLREVTLPAEILVIHDMAEDTTVPFAQKGAAVDGRVRTVLNTYGRGPANAIRYGIDVACAPVAVVNMADGSDDPRQIDELARLVDRGVAVPAASRYMPGGKQVGGPRLKGFLSRWAGRSLRLLARADTRDATNSFKAYSTDFARQVGIDSRTGFPSGSSSQPRRIVFAFRLPRSPPSGSIARSASRDSTSLVPARLLALVKVPRRAAADPRPAPSAKTRTESAGDECRPATRNPEDDNTKVGKW